MVDTLVGHFESPAYISPNKRIIAGGRTAAGAGGRKVMVENTMQKGTTATREMKKRIPAGVPVKAARQVQARGDKEKEKEVPVEVEMGNVGAVELSAPVVTEVRTDEVVEQDGE